MATRIRILTGCFALGLLALLLTGTAARAVPPSSAHAADTGASVSAASPARHDPGHGRAGYPGLRLITCGGPFDQATGHYLDNIIRYAHLVA